MVDYAVLFSQQRFELADFRQQPLGPMPRNGRRKLIGLFDQDVVLQEVQTEEGFDLRVRWSADQEAAFQRL